MYLERISPSRRSTWGQCRLKYKYKYVDYFEGFDPGSQDAMAFGSYIHRVLELGVECKSLDAIKVIAESEKKNYSFPKSFNSKIEVCLRNFLKFNAGLREVGKTEFHFEAEIAEGIKSHGIIDRVVKGAKGGLLVIDYKTGKREKTRFDLSQDKQGITYVDGIHTITGCPINKITFAHFYPVTGNLVTVTYPVGVVNKNRKQIIREVWNIRKAKKCDLKPMENNFCKSCEFRSGCSVFSPPMVVEEAIKNAKKRPKPDTPKDKK